MGITRVDLYEKEELELAEMFRVLGHPGRLAILKYLLKSEGCITGEIVEEVGLAQPTISQHLKVLKGMGIVQGRITGTSVCYCINAEKWEEWEMTIRTYFKDIANRFNCC
ncbi:MAG: ArsR family transcriptional regulator [Saprospirales bacterium]|nr:MAG: ArsR family transcriptional regulator [Saprospirales bacterium]